MIRLAADPIAVAIKPLREAGLMAIKWRNTCSADLVTARIRVPGGKRIKDRLPFLRSLQSIRSKGQAKPRSDRYQTVAPCGLKGRFRRGRGTPLRAIGEAPVGLRASHRVELQSNPQGSVKCARAPSRADSGNKRRHNALRLPLITAKIERELIAYTILAGRNASQWVHSRPRKMWNSI